MPHRLIGETTRTSFVQVSRRAIGGYARDAATDPLGAKTGTERGFRGGGWESSDADLVRAALRSADAATVRYHVVGFRCARGESSGGRQDGQTGGWPRPRARRSRRS